MKVFGKNLSVNNKRRLKTAAIVFTTILTGSAATYAQSIDDILKPKPIAAKTRTSGKTVGKMPAKMPIKTVAKTIKKTGGQSEKKPHVAKIKPRDNPSVAVYTRETPDQILNRYMNFQQTASVTDRDWNSVIAQTAKILKDNPNHSTAKAQTLIAQGQIAYNQNNFSLAITNFKSALQIMPSSSLLHYSLGKAYLANGQATAAERSLKESIEQNEKFALAYKSLGDAFAAQGERKTAEKYFKKATEISVRDGNMNP